MISHKSLGNNMKLQRSKKNNPVCKKNPIGVGQPPSDAIVIQLPATFCKSL